MLKRMLLLLLSSHVPRENHYIEIDLYDINFASRNEEEREDLGLQAKAGEGEWRLQY